MEMKGKEIKNMKALLFNLCLYVFYAMRTNPGDQKCNPKYRNCWYLKNPKTPYFHEDSEEESEERK